jgi:hypothetical protein
MALWYGYRGWSGLKAVREEAQLQRISQAVAQIWIGSATYRDQPEKFVIFRDSLLKADGITQDEIDKYIKNGEADPDDSYLFSQTVSRKVDSIYRIIDSTLRANRPPDTSTVKVARHRITPKKPAGATPRIQMPTDSVPDSLR